MQPKEQKRIRRHRRIRARISGTVKVPRLYIFRSNKHIYAQLIDDRKGNILDTASDLELKKMTKTKVKKIKSKEEKKRTGKTAIAYDVGKLIARKALKKKIEKIKFDRGGNKYHGRIKSLAEGARSAGLKF